MSEKIELRRGDEVTRSWPDDQLLVALEAFWFALLEEGSLYDRWHRTRLCLPGRRDVEVPFDERALQGLAVRRSEAGFIKSVAEVHAQHLEGPVSLERLLELEPHPPKQVQQVIDVLRAAMSITAPLRHLGKLREPRPVPPGAVFTIAETHGVYANGAGTITTYSGWQLDVFTHVRITVDVESSDEQGAETSWSITVRARGDVQLEPLLDGFKEQGLWVRTQLPKVG